MRFAGIPGAHLTYCSNIHPGESWDEVRGNLRDFVPRIKQATSPGKSFGLGLRLSALAARELESDEALSWLQDFLEQNDCYVFTINGFPYGAFHGTSVKDQAYRPDWRSKDRLSYTNRLARLLGRLLPDDPLVEGSISTVPLAYSRHVSGSDELRLAAENLIRHVAYLVDLRRNTGRTVALGLEPEADCVLETTDQVVQFFRRYLHAPSAASLLSLHTGLPMEESLEALRCHLGVCLDVCHLSLQFESAGATLSTLSTAGIRVVKAQLSSCIELRNPELKEIEALRAMDDGVYLHQVVVRRERTLGRHPDIAQAIESENADATSSEWRVHFHVPIHLEEIGPFRTTANHIREFLIANELRQATKHLEVETYTWSVMPEEYRPQSVVENVCKEFAWLKQQSGFSTAQ